MQGGFGKADFPACGLTRGPDPGACGEMAPALRRTAEEALRRVRGTRATVYPCLCLRAFACFPSPVGIITTRP